MLYKILINERYTQPTSISFWSKTFPEMKNIEEKQWENMFTLPHNILNEVKIIMTQYKLLNNIINCSVKLKDWHLTDSNRCPHCNKIDDIVHYFLLCQKTKIFWKSLIRWWSNNFNLKIDVDRNDIKENLLLGFMSNNIDHQALNFVCLYAKYHIYINKQFGKDNASL